jgi:LmbE family N-acetylglucosaminyl deacetylase
VKTVVAFHAHADDVVLLTGGTIARLAAEGTG